MLDQVAEVVLERNHGPDPDCKQAILTIEVVRVCARQTGNDAPDFGNCYNQHPPCRSCETSNRAVNETNYCSTPPERAQQHPSTTC